MNKQDVLKDWKQEEAYGFSGWDFSHLNGRVEEEPLPWSYRTVIEEYLKPHHTLLDMGTGGGEFLLSLGHPHDQTHVTEGYLPNLSLCQSKLGALGINVQFVAEDMKLSFEDEQFDVVLSRHESFDLHEVHRVLKPGGIFITQQVGPNNNRAFADFLVGDVWHLRQIDNTLPDDLATAKKLGFDVLCKDECYPELKFYDVGAVVYYAKIIEWEFSGFTVDGCAEKLFMLEEEVRSRGFVTSKEHRYMLALKKR